MNKITIAIVSLTVVVLGVAAYIAMKPLAAPVDTSAAADQQASSMIDSLVSAAATSSPSADATPATAPLATNPSAPLHATSATLHTTMGDITFAFSPNLAPNTVANFVKLASAGFYDGTKFHRVIKGFMIQGGDPLTKDNAKVAQWGTGGPGYQFNDEITSQSKNVKGTVSMANSGPNTDGSQFFINVVDNSFLDGKYTVFGTVTSGMDIAEKINATPTDSSDRPLTAVVITSVTLK